MRNEKERSTSHTGMAKPLFLLIEPKDLGDSGEIAKRIADCKGVKEVHLTSGNYGFVVSANAGTEGDVKQIRSNVRKASKSRAVKVALSHFVYR